MDETKIKELIKKIISKEIKQQENKFNKHLKQKDEVLKKQLNKIEKTIKDLKKEKLDKNEIKKMLIKAFIEQNKFMYEKSSLITQYINNI